MDEPQRTPRKPRRGDLLETHFDRLDRKGLGVGWAEHVTGRYRVTVRHALPGSTAVVDVGRRRSHRIDARVHELLDAGPFAREAPCSHYGLCGGCSFQSLAYERQLEELRVVVREALESEGVLGDLEVEPVAGAEDPWHYRNKMDFTFGNRRWVEAHEGEGVDTSFALGLHVAGRHEKVLDVRECHIAFREANPLLGCVRELAREQGLDPWDLSEHQGFLRHLVLRKGVHTNQILVDLVTSREEPELMQRFVAALLERHPEITTLVQNVTSKVASVAVGEYERVWYGPGVIEETLGGVRFEISAGSFFQTNTAQAERLVEIVREEAGLTGDEVLYDLYCGAGTLGLALASSARQVVGFECVPSAVEDARRNAQRNGIERAQFHLGDVLDFVRHEEGQGHLIGDEGTPLPAADVCLIDPPRAGLHPKVARALSGLSSPRLVYVSCNIQATARDLVIFAEGGYRLRRVRPIDLFPHTPHVECVLTLERHTDR